MANNLVFRPIILCLVLTSAGISQTSSSSINGVVMDTTGSVIPGATVVIKQE